MRHLDTGDRIDLGSLEEVIKQGGFKQCFNNLKLNYEKYYSETAFEEAYVQYRIRTLCGFEIPSCYSWINLVKQ